MSVDGDTSGDWLWADWVVGGGCVMRRETSVMSLAADFPTPVEGSGAGTRVVAWVRLELRLGGFEEGFAVDLDFYVALILGEGFEVCLHA